MTQEDIGKLRIEGLIDAINRAGSQGALAELINRSLSKEVTPQSQSHVSAWLNRYKKCPAEFVLIIEAATGVSRHKLRPDVFGLDPS